ncbi:CapA family protein [Coprobacter tertius]|uniref:CapA family protein n=1 Tax=Coprobacter tertius TaxID=2944915 RepID=A0ABT1MLQ6_9BACT|nr:CapA family protein [Coprobacter tertius]MCP9613014.1 CapA family protein [Coprobacter tertius]
MLRIVGDINLTDGFFDTGFGIGSRMAKGEDPFRYLKRRDGDFWIGNLECVCADISIEKGLYGRQFIVSPEHLKQIRHFDLYGVANNHVMQHGEEAYKSMLQYIRTVGSQYVGSATKKSFTFVHQGRNVGIIAFSQRPENFSKNPLYWSMPEYEKIVIELQLIADCDFKIAYIHWGNEFIGYPYNDQQQFAHWLVDIGFDLVVGMHPHVLQGYEIYRNKYIFYSLGNFVFNMPWEPTKYSIVLNVDLSDKPAISYDYIHIGNDCFPVYILSEEVPERLRFEYLNRFILLNRENELYYKTVFKSMNTYRIHNYIGILKNIFRYKYSDFQVIFFDFLKRRMAKKEN